MQNQVSDESPRNAWRPIHVYGMACVCLVLGVGIGYLVRGSQPLVANPGMRAVAQAVPQAQQPAAMGEAAGPNPTAEAMKQIAEKTASPYLAKLKADPKNAELLNYLGYIYRVTRQYSTAEQYYSKALQIQPRNVAIRTDLASCLYFNGDVDGAIAELNTALGYEPKFKGALLNMGIMKWKGKNDVPGAMASWEKLLKSNPDEKQRELVRHLMEAANKGNGKVAVIRPKS